MAYTEQGENHETPMNLDGLVTPHLYSTVGSYYLDIVEPYTVVSLF